MLTSNSRGKYASIIGATWCLSRWAFRNLATPRFIPWHFFHPKCVWTSIWWFSHGPCVVEMVRRHLSCKRWYPRHIHPSSPIPGVSGSICACELFPLFLLSSIHLLDQRDASLAPYYFFLSTWIHVKECHCGNTWANLTLSAWPCWCLASSVSFLVWTAVKLAVSTVLCDSVYLLILLKGSSAKTIALLCVGLALLILAAINEVLTSRSPIIPPRLFKVSLCRRGDNHSVMLQLRQGLRGSYWLPVFSNISHIMLVSTA